jgi:hypothetical protein
MTAVFPVYFSIQTALPVVLALTYPEKGALGASGVTGVLHTADQWGVLVPLATTFVTALLNLAVVGPATTSCMNERKLQGLTQCWPLPLDTEVMLTSGQRGKTARRAMTRLRILRRWYR